MENFWKPINTVITANKLTINFFDHVSMGRIITNFLEQIENKELWKWSIVMPDLKNLAAAPLHILDVELGNQNFCSLFGCKTIAKRIVQKWPAVLTIVLIGEDSLKLKKGIGTFFLTIIFWEEIYEQQIRIEMKEHYETNYFQLEAQILKILYKILKIT